MKHVLYTMLVFLCLAETGLFGAVRGDRAMYVGGTLSNIEEKTKGKLDLSSETAAKFSWEKGELIIPYGKITSLEYGQKAGRRIGVAIAVSPLALFSKKRKHYLTVGFVDENGKQQGAVFELAKGVVRETLTVLETRSGKSIEYESEEARKNLGK